MKKLLIALVLAAGVTLGSSVSAQAIDCIIFDDGIRTHEEIMEACREFAEDYVYEPPDYEVDFDDMPLWWHLYDLGLIDEEPSQASEYEVQDGDLSLWTISQKLGVSFGALLDANPDSPDLIRVGDRINLP